MIISSYSRPRCTSFRMRNKIILLTSNELTTRFFFNLDNKKGDFVILNFFHLNKANVFCWKTDLKKERKKEKSIDSYRINRSMGHA